MIKKFQSSILKIFFYIIFKIIAINIFCIININNNYNINISFSSAASHNNNNNNNILYSSNNIKMSNNNNDNNNIEYTNEEIIQHLVKNIRLPRTSEMKSDPANSPSSSFIGEIYQPTLISTKQDVQNKIIWEQWTLRSEPSEHGLIPILIAKPMVKQEKKNILKYPCVIVSHGTGGNRNQMEFYLKSLVKNNFIGVSFDSRYHGDRAKHRIKDYHEALVRSYKTNGKFEKPFIYDTIHDVQHILTFLLEKRNDVSPDIGMTGISLGGMNTWFASAIDSRIKCAVPFIGVQNFKYAVEHNLYQSRVDTLLPVFEYAKEQLGKEKISADVVDHVWNIINPGITNILDASNTLKLIAPRPLFIMNGEIDLRTPKKGVDIAYEICKKEYMKTYKNEKAVGKYLKYYVNPNGGHTVNKVMWEKAIEFFIYHLINNKYSGNTFSSQASDL